MGDQEQKGKRERLQRLRRRLDGEQNTRMLTAILKALIELLEDEL